MPPLSGKPAVQVQQVGGPFERELMSKMLSRLPPGVIASGHDRTLRELAALVGRCAAVVTGDTLCLHVACALGVPVVALFGPTSAAEIELYGNGDKIVANQPVQKPPRRERKPR